MWGGVSAFQEMKNKVVENAGWCRRSDVQQPQGYIDGTQAFEILKKIKNKNRDIRGNKGRNDRPNKWHRFHAKDGMSGEHVLV